MISQRQRGNSTELVRKEMKRDLQKGTNQEHWGTFFAALQHCIVRDVKEEVGTGNRRYA